MSAEQDSLATLFSSQTCAALMPPGRADEFFDALFGDAEEGAYDIGLGFIGVRGGKLCFEILLHERPGRCLACNLTYGLPQVFSRHPVIDVAGMVEKIGAIIGKRGTIGSWKLGSTQERSRALHSIPLTIDFQPA